jgi:hypothetical protein
MSVAMIRIESKMPGDSATPVAVKPDDDTSPLILKPGDSEGPAVARPALIVMTVTSKTTAVSLLSLFIFPSSQLFVVRLIGIARRGS